MASRAGGRSGFLRVPGTLVQSPCHCVWGRHGWDSHPHSAILLSKRLSLSALVLMLGLLLGEMFLLCKTSPTYQMFSKLPCMHTHKHTYTCTRTTPSRGRGTGGGREQCQAQPTWFQPCDSVTAGETAQTVDATLCLDVSGRVLCTPDACCTNTKHSQKASTWMDLEIIMLSEVSQTEKDKYHMISLICGI